MEVVVVGGQKMSGTKEMSAMNVVVFGGGWRSLNLESGARDFSWLRVILLPNARGDISLKHSMIQIGNFYLFIFLPCDILDWYWHETQVVVVVREVQRAAWRVSLVVFYVTRHRCSAELTILCRFQLFGWETKQKNTETTSTGILN